MANTNPCVQYEVFRGITFKTLGGVTNFTSNFAMNTFILILRVTFHALTLSCLLIFFPVIVTITDFTSIKVKACNTTSDAA